MNQSHANFRRRDLHASSVNAEMFLTAQTAPGGENSTGNGQTVTSLATTDAQVVREILADAMRKCPRSRAELAEMMSRLSGTAVTEIQLNKYCAESRSDYRFPAELVRAFCVATGDNRLLTHAAEAVGLTLMDRDACALMELGREFLRQKRAAAAIASLEQQLEGVEL